MAAIDITISGVLYDKVARTTQPIVLIGEASLSGVGVGGGPMVPPEGGQPPGIWGPPGPWPTPPIQLPPGTWPPQQPPHPAHPIVTPPPAGEKPPEPVQPPIDWKAVWHPTEGWIVVGIPNVPHPAPST